jgi:aminoglycoside 6'-N-acetyltransferase I
MTDMIHQAAQVLHEVFAPQGSWTTLAEAEEEVHDMLDPERFVRVALIGDELVGWIGGIPAYHGHVWELHPIVVKPAYQRQGIGALLIRDFEAQVKARDGLTIQLGTDDVTNATTLSNVDLYSDTWGKIATIRNLKGHPYEFYQKQGYQIIGVVPDANGWGKPDIIMGKRVG